MKNIISRLNRIKVILFYSDSTNTIYKHSIFTRIVNNYIMLPIKRVFSNIKYILTSDLVELDALDVVDDKVRYLEDKLEHSIKDRLSNLESDVEDKCSEYQVEDVIYNQFGSVEDFITYDDLNEVKDDINDIKEITFTHDKKLTTIIDEDIIKDERIDTTLGVDDIKNVDSLLQEVNTLHSLFNQLTQDVEKLSKHSCNNLFSYSLKEWDLLVNDIIKSIISRVEYNDNV